MDHRILWILVATISIVAGCGEDSPTGPPPVVPVDFATEIQPLFDLRCTACHFGDTPTGSLRLTEGHTRAETVGVDAVGYPGEWRVRPGEPDSSVLYLKISGATRGTRMPPAGPMLPDEIERVRRWIAEGANP